MICLHERVRLRYLRILTLIVVMLIATGAAFSQVGKLEGRIVDSETGEPVIGANAIIPGTTIGAAADREGEFFILNMRPGTYEIVISAIGYAQSRIENVLVVGGRTTTLDVIQLVPEAIAMDEVIIVAERPVVDRTQTSTRTTITSQEIGALPVVDMHQLIGTTASSFGGFVRGGRQFETRTIVDGVDVSDVTYTVYQSQLGLEYGVNYVASHKHDQSRNTMLNVNVGAIEELALNTGAVDADFTSATAGVVSMSLREGRGDLNVSLTVRNTLGGLSHYGPDIYVDQDKYFEEYQQKVANGLPEQRLYTWTPDKYSYGEKPETDISLTLGGTMVPGVHLFSTAHYYQTYGRFPGEFRRNVDITLRPTIEIGNNMRLRVLGMLQDDGEIFGWKNRRYSDLWRFFLEGSPVYDGYSSVFSVNFSHVLSPQTFYEFQVSHTHQSYRAGFVDSNGDGQIQWGEWDGDYITFQTPEQVDTYVSSTADDPLREKFFSTGFTDDFSRVAFGGPGTEWRLARPIPYYENVQTSTIQLRGDITSQVTRNHQLRGGIQVKLLDIDFERLSGTEAGALIGDNVDIAPYTLTGWNRKPSEIGFYIQDRMEYADLVINVGLRLDGFNRNAADLDNYFAPLRPDTLSNGIVQYTVVRGENLTTDWYLSPRIGVSHPIGERAAMYFSFSQAAQLKPYSALYGHYDALNAANRFINLAHVGQEPIRSTNYEMGVQIQLLENLGLDVNAYYRDIENYGSVSLDISQVEGPVPGGYFLVTNFGYADSRGIELTLSQRAQQLTDWLYVSGRLTYTYSYIKQAVYAGGNQTAFSGEFDEDIPFDAIKRWNTYERNVISNNSTLTGGYDRPHRVTISALFGFPYDVRLSLFGFAASGFYYPLTLEDPRARKLGVGPENYNFDARIDKLFKLGPIDMSLFIDIRNIFDHKNIMTYNRTDVTGGQRLWELEGDPTGPFGRVVTPDGSYVYSNPREFMLGIQIVY
jgi:hypothetical protein